MNSLSEGIQSGAAVVMAIAIIVIVYYAKVTIEEGKKNRSILGSMTVSSVSHPLSVKEEIDRGVELGAR